MDPIENDITVIKVPSHLPKTKPANKIKGEPNPSRTIQIILKREKSTKSKNVFSSLKSFNNC